MNVETEMLAPAAVLVLWSLIVLMWLAVTRFSGFAKNKIDISRGDARGARGQDLEGRLPPETMWKAHNFTHLMEQPTIFYPTVIILALAGATSFDTMVAWAYVVLRILHSLWQSIVNTIPVRFALFLLSTICLVALAVRAVSATLAL